MTVCMHVYMCEILATTKQKWWKWKEIRAKTKYWVLGMFENWLSVLVIFILVRIKRQVIGERVEGGRQKAGSVGGRIEVIWSVSGWNTGEQVAWVAIRCWRLAISQKLHFFSLRKTHNIPDGVDVTTRNEDMRIFLDERAIAAWRQGGEVWEAVSSMIVMARLKWMGRRHVGGSLREAWY